MNALHRIGKSLFSRDAIAIEISPSSEIDFSKVCRTCLRETEDNNLENDALYMVGCNGKLAPLYEVFEIATGLKISTNDFLPRHICHSCLASIKSSFSFHCQSQRAHQVLESVLSSLKDSIPSNAKEEDNPVIVKTKEEEQDNDEEEENPAEEILEEIHEESQLCQEDIRVELADEHTEPDEEEEEQNEIINFDELSVDDSILLSPIEDIPPDDNEDKVTTTMEIEPFNETSEHDENSQSVVVLKNTNRVFACDYCDALFNLQRDLILHFRNVHPEEKPFKCDICSMGFVHIQSMRRHKNTHSACPKQKACPLCNWTFSRSDDLTRHMRTHTDERPYACLVCMKAFKQHTELKDHMLSHDERKMYKCEPCNKEWRSRNGWYLHMKAHQDGRNGRRKQRISLNKH